MGWNKQNNKSLQSEATKGAAIGPGAPIAYNTANVGKPYRDSWDIERAYREGMQKVTWVSRCIDAVSGNQARLPIILRKDNQQDGRIIRKKNDPLLDILNTQSNEGENSFIFRYRLSSQLLMSSRGVFIEKVRGRDGGIVALHLLPPQHTSPIPDPKKFVSGYEVLMNNGFKQILKPEDVLWIRKPHPLDPYLSLTPMESAGIAIEIENLAKVYNRNFLLNDGRPGGLLVLRGEIDDDDKDELRNRFRGNLNKTGSVTVVSADEGVDFVDTSSNPRDAAYIQMRQITKEEILASFGVPESVMGNASGRTFSNAAEELRVFWMETMMPHLMLIARALDNLDEQNYVDFDVSNVPILILSKQERERYLLEEFNSGLISANEYRDGTGKKKVESELADSLLSNPNLTPIANTEKKFEPQGQQPIDMMGAGGAPGMAGLMGEGAAPAMPGAPGAEMSGYTETPPPLGVPQDQALMAANPALAGAQPEAAAEMLPGVTAESLAGGPQPVPSPFDLMEPDENGEIMPGVPATAVKDAKTDQSVSGAPIEVKIDATTLTEWDMKAEQTTERWTEILDRSLERLFERQQRVILEKAAGKGAKKGLDKGNLAVEAVFDSEVWAKQLAEDIRPVIVAISQDGALSTASNQDAPRQQPTGTQYEEYVNSQVQRLQKTNETTKEEITAAILIALALGGDEDRSSMLRAALVAIFANLLGKRKRVIAEHEAQTAFNAGVYFGAQGDETAQKTWLTRRDSRVRPEHLHLHGKTVPFSEDFTTDGFLLRFPGDPVAPPHLTMNCRCRLRFQ
jgi:HK97 family phage portal protein